jgi:hypothetical protein
MISDHLSPKTSKPVAIEQMERNLVLSMGKGILTKINKYIVIQFTVESLTSDLYE